MKKRVFLLIIAILLALPHTLVNAAPAENDMRWVIDSKLNAINQELESSYSGQTGLLRKLQFLTAKIMWVEFIEKETNALEFNYNTQFLIELRKDLNRDLVNFNKQFGVKQPTPKTDEGKVTDAYFLFLKFDLWGNGEQLKYYEEYIKNTIPSYIEILLTPIVDEYNSLKTDAEKTDYVKNKSSILRYSYRVLNTLTTTSSDFGNIVGNNVLSSKSQKAYDMLSSSSKFNYLVQRGGEIDISLAVADSGDAVSSEGEYIERLANVKKKANEDVKDARGYDLWTNLDPASKSFQLKDPYIKILSAGAIYRPFVSKIGDPDFMEALKGLYDNDDDKKAIVSLYQSLRENKKPLFITTQTGFESWYNTKTSTYLNDRIESPSKEYEGSADVVTVKDFLRLMDSDGTFGLVMRKGEMLKNESDTNSFSYFSDNPNQKNLILSKGDITSSGPIWTSPVLLYNGDDKNTNLKVGALTSMVLRHIKNGITGSLEDKFSGLVFMNGFGDIVTSDNTVILPAVANPIIYKDTEDKYVPFTMSFLPFYPKLNVMGDTVTMKDYTGKYLVVQTDKKKYGWTGIKIKGDKSFGAFSTLILKPFRTSLAEEIVGAGDPFFTIDFKKLTKGLGQRVLINVTNMIKRVMQSEADNFSTNNSLSGDWKAFGIKDITRNYQSIFDYNPLNDKDFELASFYARNMYKSFTRDTQGNLISSAEILDHDYIFKNILLEGMNGSIYADSYTKNVMMDASEDEQYYGFFKKIFVFFAKETMGAVGSADSILGMKSFYEDSLFGPVLGAIDQYFMIILAVILMLFLLRYLRDKESLLRLGLFTVGSTVILVMVVKIFPIYVPTLYNTVVTNINNKLGYDVLTLKTEKYDLTYDRSGTNQDESSFFVNGTTLSLYKFSDSQMKTFTEANNIKKGTANSGSIYMVDSVNGIFFEGNSLKISTDLLFKNNPVTGSYVNTDLGTIYQIKSAKEFPSMVDYYMPYYQIEDGLVSSINQLPKIFTIIPNSLMYSSGITKHSFMFYQFVNSAPFLSPAQYDDPEFGFSIEELNNMKYYYDNPSKKTNSYDFLGLDKMLSDPTPEMKETLWYKTMDKQGYFQDYDKYWRLIEAVNSQTKKFMIELGNNVSLMSDENLIKVTSLFATTVFNQKISTFGEWVYPSNLNYQEFIMQDVYLATLTDNLDKFLSEDQTLVDYVGREGTVLSLILLTIEMWTTWLISKALSVLTLIIFVMFVLLWIGRFALSEKVSNLIKGFFKVGISLLILGTIFYSSFGIADKMSVIGALITLFCVQMGLIYFLFVLATGIFFNLTELGDGQFKGQMKSLNSRLESLVDKVVPFRRKSNSVVPYSKYREMYKFNRDMDANLTDYIPTYNNPYMIYRTRNIKREEHDSQYYDSDKISQLEEYRREKERLERQQKNRRYDDLGG